MYLAVLGRETEISIAELESFFGEVKKITSQIATFTSSSVPEINRLGGSIKLAEKLPTKPLDFLLKLSDGKITIGVSDYSKNASKKSSTLEAMKFKKILTRHGRSVRAVIGDAATLSSATSLHNGMSGKNPHKIELIKVENEWFKVIGVQDIDAYTKRDQARPARDAKVGMLPPKLAQILINLCGVLPKNATILDPFCGTGVVLQEALLMGYRAYGTDISEKMVDYTRKNLEWLLRENPERASRGTSAQACQKNTFLLSQGDATSFQWQQPIDAIACEGYLGKPMSKVPSEMELKAQQQICQDIILVFLKNLSSQIRPKTPIVIAIPAWLRPDNTYSRLDILDLIQNMGYNVNNKSLGGLLYYREGQIVARDIIILRKD